MILLAVDTSTRWAGVGLQIGSDEPTETIWRSDQNHGRELMPAIVGLLAQAKLTPIDITHLAAALGPGGFSAVRVGISTVIGLALKDNLPVVGVSTHELEAYPFIHNATASKPLISLIPAGRGELSWTKFESPDSTPKTGLDSLEEMVESQPSTACFCGEGAELLQGRIDQRRILSSEPPTRSPKHLLEIARVRLEAGKSTPVNELRPIYARPPSITMRKNPA